MTIITTIVMVFGIFATGAGVLELLSGSGPTFLFIGLACLFGPIIFRMIFGKKKAEKDRTKRSKCSRCGRNIGGGKYEYTFDLKKARKIDYDNYEVDAYITAHCPHCGKKKTIYENVPINAYRSKNPRDWRYPVEHYIKDMMDGLDR